MPRKIRSESEWKLIIRKYEESGLSQSAYCREKGIDPSSFYRNLSKFSRSEKEVGSFIEVQAERNSLSFSESRATIVTPKGYRIEIDGSFGVQNLAHILRIVESC
jgi:hypothetical protein